jgi:hypothetical protein
MSDTDKTAELAGPVEREVRSQRWLCQSCYWAGSNEERLRAINPFEDGTIYACPKCKAVEDMTTACDVDGCDQPLSVQWSTESGRRSTCLQHRYAA